MSNLVFRGACFFVADVEETLAFYNRTLDIPTYYLHPSRGYGELQTGKALLAFISRTFIEDMSLFGDIPIVYPRPGEPTIGAQVTFMTEHLDEVWQKAVAAGAVVHKPPAQKPWGQTVGFLFDPNGVIVELCSPSLRP
jgi:lactoylglutathione lyase